MRRALETSFSPREVIGILSKLIARTGALAPTIGGTIRFVIAGKEGGTWIVSLDAAGGAWAPGESRTADTTIYATAEAFPALILGRDLAEHMTKGEIIVRGDRDKLPRLGALIARGGGAIAMRARHSTARKAKEVRG